MSEAKILDGKALARRLNDELRVRVAAFTARRRAPKLCVLRVGDDPASAVYVRNKANTAATVGIDGEVLHWPSATHADVLAQVQRWNADDGVDGILVQLPLPKGIDAQAILDAIDPSKDVDGFHAENAGLLSQGRPGIVACTPKGVMRLIAEARGELSGLHAVVVGRSNIVGKPQSMLLLNADCTVTVCHSRTRDLAAIVGQGDIVVAAVGRAEIVRGEWIKPGAIVIDVGMNRVGDKLVGDVEFAAAARRASAITPVPGGVGPMTIAMLLDNALTCAERR